MSELSGEVALERRDNHLLIQIITFSSSEISNQLAGFADLDWRSVVEQVEIDLNYNDKTFNVDIVDRPAEEVDYVKGSYEVELDKVGQRIAVKVTDILGGVKIFTATTDEKS